jgi:hypothetical protein
LVRDLAGRYLLLGKRVEQLWERLFLPPPTNSLALPLLLTSLQLPLTNISVMTKGFCLKPNTMPFD